MKAFVVLNKEIERADGLVDFESPFFLEPLMHFDLQDAMAELSKEDYPEEFAVYEFEFIKPREILEFINMAYDKLVNVRFHVRWIASYDFKQYEILL